MSQRRCWTGYGTSGGSFVGGDAGEVAQQIAITYNNGLVWFGLMRRLWVSRRVCFCLDSTRLEQCQYLTRPVNHLTASDTPEFEL